MRGRLSQEEERVQHYMHASTRKQLMQTCLQTLMATHVEAILDKGFAPLMEQMRLDDLTRMYSLFLMVDALPKLRQVLLLAASSNARAYSLFPRHGGGK